MNPSGPLSDSDKIEKIREYKVKGNAAYKEGKFGKAAGSYHRAILYIKGLSKNCPDLLSSLSGMAGDGATTQQPKRMSPEQEADVSSLTCDCYNNLAACLLKDPKPKYEKVIDYCDKALEVSPLNVKALYRKGTSLYALGDYDKALETLQKAPPENIRRGTNLHANILEFLGGKPQTKLQIMPENEGHWGSLCQVLAEVGDVKALEVEILHPRLLYKGILDCLAVYKDVLCLIDWKTSKQPRPLLKNTYDDPLQVVAYLGAVNACDQFKNEHGHMNHGVIVVAYPDGSPAHVHWMDQGVCETYWAQWTQRLHLYFQTVYTEKLDGGKKQVTFT